jgi:hypothetical protein
MLCINNPDKLKPESGKVWPHPQKADKPRVRQPVKKNSLKLFSNYKGNNIRQQAP